MARTRPLHAPLMLVTGVLWDFLTLRIDRLFDNLLLGLYLLALALVIVLQLRMHLGTGLPEWLGKRIHWVHNLGHFLLGGLLSAYLIYYFRGAPLLRASLWLVVLGGLAVAHELVPRRFKVPSTWVPVLVVLTFHYGLAVGPVLYGDFIGSSIPLLMGVALAAAVHLLASVRWPGLPLDGRVLNRTLFGSSAGVGVAVVLELMAFRADLVPPIPLTLMGSQVVPEQHEAHEVSEGRQLLARLGWAPKLTWTEGLRVEVRTPVFLPVSMATTILHVWEVREASGWSGTDAIRLQIKGGREAGFRTYSRKRHLKPGRWRVRVTTEDHRELGRVRFDLERDPAKPERADPPPSVLPTLP